jgi:hypothetical protein
VLIEKAACAPLIARAKRRDDVMNVENMTARVLCALSERFERLSRERVEKERLCYVHKRLSFKFQTQSPFGNH